MYRSLIMCQVPEVDPYSMRPEIYYEFVGFFKKKKMKRRKRRRGR